MAQHPVYILPSTPDEFNLSFYQRYDPAFLFNKVVALKDILDRKEEITARREQMEDLADDAGAASFEALQAEIHFTEMHQFEVFFMLLLADFQRVPHWIYLTEYPPSMPRQKAEQYIAKEIGALTGDRFTTRQALIRHAIYSTIVPTDPDLLHRWEENSDKIAAIIERLAQRYLRYLRSYNSYKHGLRVMNEHTTFTIELEDQPPTVVMSGRTLNYLHVQNDEHGRRVVHTLTQFFDPESSYEYIVLMYHLLRTMKNVRIAVLTKQVTFDYIHHFLDVDLASIPDLDKMVDVQATPRPRPRRATQT